ncbi:hypothetical protein BRC89_10780 [Halobacteriales archaeon QS_4_70_19]|nr:MAG: hypothetical protein BRC89_10780 [Halobacteriales archaeon QS_4_70_19]
MRRQAAILAVLALVLLSGCSLLGGEATPTTEPTATATATETPVPYPDGYSSDGVTNATAARAGHVDGLLATANYTLGYNATVCAENGTTRVTLLQSISPAEPRALSDTIVASGGDRGSQAVRRTRYYADGTQYVRVQRDGNTSYGTINGTVPATAFVGSQYVDAVLTNVSYDTATRFERANETFFRFTTSSIDDPGALLSDGISPDEVASGNVTLVVDRDGIVQSVRYNATVSRDGRTTRYSVTVAVAGIGNTTVQRPDWAQAD